jgi:large subunit ribosomal protein L10
MAKTRKQKEDQIKELEASIKESNGFLAFGFSKSPVNDLNDFRSEIRNAGGLMKVIKKNLLNIALKNNNVDFKPEQFLGQTGLVIFNGNISDVAGIVYKFITSNKKEGKMLGGFDGEKGKALEAEFVEKVGQLPSRDVLLGQVVGAFSGPIRAFVYTLKAIAEEK